MNDPEPRSAAISLAAPRFLIRFAWWFVIYLGSSSLLAIALLLLEPGRSRIQACSLIADIWREFPLGFVGFCELFPGLSTASDHLVNTVFTIVGCVAYLLYLAHFVLMCGVTTKKAFRALLIGLVIIVGMNLIFSAWLLRDSLLLFRD